MQMHRPFLIDQNIAKIIGVIQNNLCDLKFIHLHIFQFINA
jgi:hypothetical protein